MPIDKSIKNKKIFSGMTEYLAKINQNQYFMLMNGDIFINYSSYTHINLKNVHKNVKLNVKNLN